jgi:hypothetical protein
MSRRVGNVIILEPEDDAKCEFCGKVAELRPYGPNRERICFECAMKDEATTRRIMARDLFGQGETH